MTTWEPTGQGKVISPHGAEWSLSGARELLARARSIGWGGRKAIQDLAAAIELEASAPTTQPGDSQ